MNQEKAFKYPRIKDRVRSGANELRRVNPDWYKKLNLNSLNLADRDNDILSQIFGSFVDGFYFLNLSVCGCGPDDRDLCDFGFDAYDIVNDEHVQLTSEWIKFANRLLNENGAKNE